jgi:hypothetical protein
MRVAQVLQLAQAYAAAHGGSLRTVGLKAAGNNLLFVRLADGHGCNVHSIERAADWLVANWPDDVPWPENVPRPLPAKEPAKTTAA